MNTTIHIFLVIYYLSDYNILLLLLQLLLQLQLLLLLLLLLQLLLLLLLLLPKVTIITLKPKLLQ